MAMQSSLVITSAQKPSQFAHPRCNKISQLTRVHANAVMVGIARCRDLQNAASCDPIHSHMRAQPAKRSCTHSQPQLCSSTCPP